MNYGDTLGFVVLVRLPGGSLLAGAVQPDIESAREQLQAHSEVGHTCWLTRCVYEPGSEA